MTERRQEYVYVQNLYRKPRLVFVAALQFGGKAMQSVTFALHGQPAKDDRFAVELRRGQRTSRVQFDLTAVAARLS